MLSRRDLLAKAIPATALLAVPGGFRTLWATELMASPEMLIRKNPGCMCCNGWAAHLIDNGIAARVEEAPDLAAYKDEQQVPEALRSCHTGLIDRYVVEGHVPAEDILRLLQTRPAVRGIAVAGMPAGSPGMEGDRVDPYEVIAFGGSEGEFVFARHG